MRPHSCSGKYFTWAPLKRKCCYFIKLSSLAALKVVKMTTCSRTSDENFIKMTTYLFQWLSQQGGCWWHLFGVRSSATIMMAWSAGVHSIRTERSSKSSNLWISMQWIHLTTWQHQRLVNKRKKPDYLCNVERNVTSFPHHEGQYGPEITPSSQNSSDHSLPHITLPHCVVDDVCTLVE